MKIHDLSVLLKEKGFKEEKLDSGMNYTRTIGHIELICYIEPGIEVEFISIYRWNNNDVKGTYNISMQELNNSNEKAATFFRKTKNNLPECIGEKVDTHIELDKVIEETFGY